MLGLLTAKFAFFAFIFLLYVRPAQAQVPKTKLKILAWNVQLLPRHFAWFSPHLRKKQRLRNEWIIKHLEESDVELVALQEVFDGPLRRRLRRRLRKAYPHQLRVRGPWFRYSDGLLVLSKYPLKKEGYCRFKQGRGTDKMAAKACLLFCLKKGERPLQFALTHLQSGGNQEEQRVRDAQYLEMRKLFDGQTKAGQPLVLVGDLNTERHLGPRYEGMLSALALRDWPLLDSLPFTFCSSNSWNGGLASCQLDYILSNEACELEGLKILRLWTEHKGRRLDYADHYGLEAVLSY